MKWLATMPKRKTAPDTIDMVIAFRKADGTRMELSGPFDMAAGLRLWTQANAAVKTVKGSEMKVDA